MTDREQQLRDKAYQIWQTEGEPHGRDKDHWDEAERTLAPAADADATARETAAPTGEDYQPGGEAPPATGEAPAVASAGHALTPTNTGEAASADAAAPPPPTKAAKPRTPRAKGKPVAR